MSDRERALDRMYTAFNNRDIETVLALLHPEVDWPNGWEGGRILGRDGVRDYWTRQWAAIDPAVYPLGYRAEPDGRLAVEVRQRVHDLEGKLLFDGIVQHVYRFRDGLVDAMEIEKASTKLPKK